MNQPDRTEHLNRDAMEVRELADQSSVFDCEIFGDPPHRLLLTFRGKGFAPEGARGGDPGVVERHEVELLVGYAYPQQPPEIRFQTPLFHPAVSTSGFATTASLGLEWNERMGLEIVCERVWDVIRAAQIPTTEVQNPTAEKWFAERPQDSPLDPRPLRDSFERKARNIIQYRLKSVEASGGTSSTGSSLQPSASSSIAIPNRASHSVAASKQVAPPIVDPQTPRRPVTPVPHQGIQWTGSRDTGSKEMNSLDEGITFVDERSPSELRTDEGLAGRDAPIVFLDRTPRSLD